MKPTVSNIVEKVITALSVIFCVSVAILDFTGLLDQLPPIADRLPTISLLLLSGITAYIVFIQPEKEVARHLEIISRTSNIEEAINAIDLIGGRVQIFKNEEECLIYTKHRIKNAKTKVSSIYADPNYDLYKAAPPNILYRETLLIEGKINPSLQAQIQVRIDSAQQSYYCSFFPPTKGVYYQFVVVDSSEVIFLSNLSANNIAVKHPQIVHLFQYYYDETERLSKRIR